MLWGTGHRGHRHANHPCYEGIDTVDTDMPTIHVMRDGTQLTKRCQPPMLWGKWHSRHRHANHPCYEGRDTVDTDMPTTHVMRDGIQWTQTCQLPMLWGMWHSGHRHANHPCYEGRDGSGVEEEEIIWFNNKCVQFMNTNFVDTSLCNIKLFTPPQKFDNSH